MEVVKRVDLGKDKINITGMFERKLLETTTKDSPTYKNNMDAFDVMLQDIADNAFKLGQENP